VDSYASEQGQMAGCLAHGNKQNMREIFILAQDLSISEGDNYCFVFFFCE